MPIPLHRGGFNLTFRPQPQAQGGTRGEARRRQAAGFTLLETITVLFLFMLIMSAVLSNMVAAQQLSALTTAESEIDSGANIAIASIASDLTSAGWYLPDTPSQYLSGPGVDRTLQYYPYVMGQGSATSAALPSNVNFAPMIRAAPLIAPNTQSPYLAKYMPKSVSGALARKGYGSVTDFTATFTDTKAYYDSYFAPSQELIFIRAASGAWLQNSVFNGSANATVCADATTTRYAYNNTYCSSPNSLPSSYAPPTLNFQDKPGTDPLWLKSGNNDALGVLYMSGFLPIIDPVTHQVTGYDELLSPSHVPPVVATEKPYGRVLDCCYWDQTNSTQELQWEGMGLPTYVPVTSQAIYDNSKFREYMYCVVPSPTSLGQLVRAVKIDPAYLANFTWATYNPTTNSGKIGVGNIISRDATSGYFMVIDKILSQNVVRVVFDTVRTVSDVATTSGATTTYSLPLSPNQVRVRIYLMYPSLNNPNVLTGQILENVLSMRALTGVSSAAISAGFSDAAVVLGLASGGTGSLSLTPHSTPGLPH